METRRKTRKAYTIQALEGRFTGYSSQKKDFAINTDYLNSMICLYLDEIKTLYEAMINTRRKPENVAWCAFKTLADEYINEDFSEPGTVFYATSQQLRDFLQIYGYGYEAIAESVKHVKVTRKKLKDFENQEKGK